MKAQKHGEQTLEGGKRGEVKETSLTLVLKRNILHNGIRAHDQASQIRKRTIFVTLDKSIVI